ncbi:ribosomal RNA small subunit methyltransferase B [Clostridia bacterium]|nr:ribosomal RNA small subunit methyltransferase B [Clostridia bacterium]
MTANALSPRRICLDALNHFERDQSYSNLALDAAIERYDLSDLDRSFLTKLFLGVIERKITLDYYYSFVGSVELERLDTAVKNAIRMALYQIFYMDRVPDSAACDESVELIRTIFAKNAKTHGFVNAVLRNIIRRKAEITASVDLLPDFQKVSVKYSVGEDVLSVLTDSYGMDNAVKIAASFEIARPLTLMVNTLKISRDAFIEYLRKDGIEAQSCRLSPIGVTITKSLPIRAIPGYEEGYFIVQDEASQICVAESGAKASDLVVDCCAAPGGKSLYTAVQMGNLGKIVSFDLKRSKLNLLDKSADRLGIGNIETIARDSSQLPLESLRASADVVLCDVPCSGIGVCAKKPEIKYKKSADFTALPKLQLKILSSASGYVKQGGILMYSTCTLNHRENEEVVADFLKSNKEFHREYFSILEYNADNLPGQTTFFPFERNIDGFFLAKLRRNSV